MLADLTSRSSRSLVRGRLWEFQAVGVLTTPTRVFRSPSAGAQPPTAGVADCGWFDCPNLSEMWLIFGSHSPVVLRPTINGAGGLLGLALGPTVGRELTSEPIPYQGSLQPRPADYIGSLQSRERPWMSGAPMPRKVRPAPTRGLFIWREGSDIPPMQELIALTWRARRWLR